MHVREHERAAPGGGGAARASMRFKERFLRCAQACVYVDSFLQQVELQHCCTCPPSASDRRFFFFCMCMFTCVFALETEDDARRKVIKRTGVKWRLKFQWQSGSNSPELSPHMSCNLADISRLLPTKNHFAYHCRLGFIVAFKFADSL